MGGLALAAGLTLGATACGSSHSSTSQSAIPTATQGDQQIQDSQEMRQITRLYWLMASDGTRPFTSVAQFEDYMAGYGGTNLETGMPGVVQGIAPGTQEHDDFMTYALHEASKGPAAQGADWASYGFGVGSFYSDSGDSSSTPAPAPAPQAAPAAPAAMDATASALAAAVTAAGQGGGQAITTLHYAVSSDGNYAAAVVQAAGEDAATAYFCLDHTGNWKMTILGTGGITAQNALMPQNVFDDLTSSLNG
jgi:hypothetical protein